MGYSYTLNCGQYVGMRNGSPVTAPMDEVAIALDCSEGFLLRHGDPQRVREYVADLQGRLRDSGAAEMADTVVCLTGRFPLDALNRCLTNSGYAGVMYREALAGTLPRLSFDGVTLEAAEPLSAPQHATGSGDVPNPSATPRPRGHQRLAG